MVREGAHIVAWCEDPQGGPPPVEAPPKSYQNDVLRDAGTFTPSALPVDEYRQVQHLGTLAGDHGHLFGLTLNLVNASPNGFGNNGGDDTARVRGIIGTVTTRGPGSVRFLHAHAIGEPSSTGPLAAVTAQVTCPVGSPHGRAIEVSNTGPGVARGIDFTASGPGHYDYAINFLQAVVDIAALHLQTGTPGGRLLWTQGGAIDSPAPNVIRIQGTLQSATVAALEARVAALEARLRMREI